MSETETLPEPAHIWLRLIFMMIFMVIWLGGVAGCLWLLHFFLTLPMRRNERARLFLDLLQTKPGPGQSLETNLVALSKTQDQTLSVRFHLVAAHVENGMRIGQALEQVPRFLPPQISAILRVGEKLGDLKRVLPACRELLKDTTASVRSSIHYLLLFAFVFSPAFVVITILLATFVFPRMLEIAAGEETAPSSFARFIFTHPPLLISIEISIFLLLIATATLYLGGPRLMHWFKFRGFPLVDWIAWTVPWKRKRLQRTFSAMLSVLLDGGVPETEAVRLAGDCTDNEICRHRAEQVIAKLESGVKLDDAIAAFDDTGEFHWRLANALHARGGFFNALRGWHESLDAKAFQQQEASAHIITTGLVVLNGVMVALIATAMFSILVTILEAVAP